MAKDKIFYLLNLVPFILMAAFLAVDLFIQLDEIILLTTNPDAGKTYPWGHSTAYSTQDVYIYTCKQKAALLITGLFSSCVLFFCKKQVWANISLALLTAFSFYFIASDLD